MATLVARPLVGGEHPGYQSDFADPGGMALTFLALLAAAGWAAWRLIARQPALYLGWADLAVVALALSVFIGASHASFRRAAWLAGWDWVGMALLYLLVRQLAVRPEERHGLVAVLLACAVAVAAEGVFQAAYQLPAQARAEQQYREEQLTEDRLAYLRTEQTVKGVTATPLELHELADRVERRLVHGPYFHPWSLAAVLALALPLAAGALLACLRGKTPAWQSALAVLCVLLLTTVLALTRAWPAIAAVAFSLVGLLACVYLGRKAGLITAILVASAGLTGLFAMGILPVAADVWPGAWRLLQDNFWLGVGPAQFVLFYPRFMAETAGGKAVDAGNAVLAVWAEAGVFGVVALASVVVLVVRAVWRWASGGHEPPERGDTQPRGGDTPRSPEATTNWEFYLGGMLGLVTAFLLRAGTLPPEDIVLAAFLAGVRAVVWFAAFSLYEGVGWTVEEHLGALATGAGAMFLCLLVGPGIDHPSVAVFLWVAVALVLATATPQPAEWLSRQAAVGMLLVPVFVATAFGYFAFFFYPAAASAAALRRAQLAGIYFYSEMRKAAGEREIRDPPAYIAQRIIEPVKKAYQEDGENVQLMTHLARWYAQLWAMAPGEQNHWMMAVAAAKLAQKHNPEGPEGYLGEEDLRRRFATVLALRAKAMEEEKPDKNKPPSMPPAERKKAIAQMREDVRKQYEYAAGLLREYLPRDPHDPSLHYQLAAVLFEAGQPDEARKTAEAARRLDGRAKSPRSLSDPERSQIEKWLKPESKR